MQASTQDTWIRRCLKAFTLWGYGWKRRKRRESVSYRIEWQDPFTGQWHGERNAVRLLKSQVLHDYGLPPRRPDHRTYF
jgi:hypothetical protein